MAESKIKHYCDKCKNDTNHNVLLDKTINEVSDEYHFANKYMVVECLGCESVSFRKELHDYEASYPDEYDNWVHDISIDIYPQPLTNHTLLREEFILPKQIRSIYKETIEALKCNCYILAGVGFRAVIEAICLDKQIPGRTLENKIDKLATNRIIADKEAEFLHTVRFLGNDSVHDIATPKKEALYVVLDIIEHLLKSLYIIEYKAKGVLDTYITEFDDFEEVLSKKIKPYAVGDEFPLAKFIGKDIRRFNGTIAQFETQLITKITSADFTKLSVGALRPFGSNLTQNHQHFIKT